MQKKPKKKPTRRASARKRPSGRQRSRKIEIFLSDDEHARFVAKCAAKSRTASDQVRFWINLEAKPRKSAPETPAPDPRQTNIEDIAPTARPEGEALRQWIEREGRTDLLDAMAQDAQQSGDQLS